MADLSDEAVTAAAEAMRNLLKPFAHDCKANAFGGQLGSLSPSTTEMARTALAAALPALTADLVAEIQQKDAELEEWRTGVLRLPVDAATSDDARRVCPCVTDDDYVHPSLRGEQ